MAKKKEVEVETPQAEQVVLEAPVVKEKPTKNNWQIKDRIYLVKDGSPVSFVLPSKHTKNKPLMWFDEEKGYQRELRYATNQKSVFVDEQKGTATLGHIVFKDGILSVSRKNQALQKFLSLYHPFKNKLYVEDLPEVQAKDELVDIEVQIEALKLAQSLDIDQLEAIMRVEQGSAVSKISSKELKRDAYIFAQQNAKLFIELAGDDSVELRNFGIRAVEAQLIELSSDQRVFTWASNGRKLMNVPFDEHPYSALAAWFKTDEGMEVYKNIEKRLK